MTVMLYKQGAGAGEMGEAYVQSSGDIKVDGAPHNWIVVADEDVKTAEKAGWSRKVKRKKAKK